MADHSAIVDRFDTLPDAAVIPDEAAAILLNTSVWTLRRHNPVPRIKISPRCGGRRVGDIRAKTRGELASAVA